MKSALKARLTSPNWIDELPWIMLGIRTAPKEDLYSSSAELVYGAPLTVPGDFVGNPSATSTTSDYLRQLRNTVQTFVPIPTSRHGSRPVAVPLNLRNARFVFVRRDSHRHPLQKPYDGPYEVLEPGDKTFKILIGLRHETISIDRLKPAHLDIDRPVQAAPARLRGRPPMPQRQAVTINIPQPATTSTSRSALENTNIPHRLTTTSGRAINPPLRYR